MFFLAVYFKSLVMVIAISSLFNTQDNFKKSETVYKERDNMEFVVSADPVDLTL